MRLIFLLKIVPIATLQRCIQVFWRKGISLMEQAVTGVYMVIVMQEDLKAGVEFYTKLGLKVAFHIPDKWCELEVGGVRVGLCPASAVEKGKHTGLVFQVADLMATYEEFKEAGIAFLNEPVTATHGIMVSCADPSGNMFDLYQPTHDNVKKTLQEAGKMCGDDCNFDASRGCCKQSKNPGGCC